MVAKKKQCPTCGEMRVLWNRKVGCQSCVRASKEPSLKQSPLNQVSKKRSKQLKEYSGKKKLYLIAHPTCEMEGCKQKSEQIHHKNHREGERLNDERFFMALCWQGGLEPCHKYIHAHPEESYEKGWLIKG